MSKKNRQKNQNQHTTKPVEETPVETSTSTETPKQEEKKAEPKPVLKRNIDSEWNITKAFKHLAPMTKKDKEGNQIPKYKDKEALVDAILEFLVSVKCDKNFHNVPIDRAAVKRQVNTVTRDIKNKTGTKWRTEWSLVATENGYGAYPPKSVEEQIAEEKSDTPKKEEQKAE